MEYLGKHTLGDIIHKMKCYDYFWIRILYSCAQKIQELHDAGIVHADLHTRNVVVTFDELGTPMAHIIDFGMSRKIGQTMGFGYHESWRQQIKGRPWYAAEIFRCGVLDESTDVVALAHMMKIILKKMKNPLPVLKEIAERGAAIQKETRPPIKEFLAVLGDLIPAYRQVEQEACCVCLIVQDSFLYIDMI